MISEALYIVKYGRMFFQSNIKEYFCFKYVWSLDVKYCQYWRVNFEMKVEAI